MDLSTLAPAPGSKRAKRRVGRGTGSGSGKTSGRGHKGQKLVPVGRRLRGLKAVRSHYICAYLNVVLIIRSGPSIKL